MAETDHCMFFIKRKKRYCRMTVKNGYSFCGEHQQNSLSTDSDMGDKKDVKRIKCPLDPTHTCYESKLMKHLKVCNAKQLLDEQPEFIVKGTNVDESFEIPEHVPLSHLDYSVIETVINKVNVAHEKLPQFSRAILQHHVLKDKLNNVCYGKAVRKHLLQNSSILAHLEQANLIQDNTCFIEFGAGKGKLTYWLGQIIKDKKNSCILLIDRSSHRHKSDNKLKNEQSSIKIKRIRADIADLQLNNVAEIQNVDNKVAIAKHLCGAATDLTLRCLIKSTQTEPKLNVTGLIIAFCCHHKCDYMSYVGKQYLESCGFSANEFPILCSIASWATCGSGLNRSAKMQNDEKHCTDSGSDVRNLSSNEREAIGYKVKSLLNWGRLEFLRNDGFKGDFVYYTSSDVSLENMCIIATRNCL